MFLGSEKDVQSLEELVNEILPALFYLDQEKDFIPLMKSVYKSSKDNNKFQELNSLFVAFLVVPWLSSKTKETIRTAMFICRKLYATAN